MQKSFGIFLSTTNLRKPILENAFNSAIRYDAKTLENYVNMKYIFVKIGARNSVTAKLLMPI